MATITITGDGTGVTGTTGNPLTLTSACRAHRGGAIVSTRRAQERRRLAGRVFPSRSATGNTTAPMKRAIPWLFLISLTACVGTAPDSLSVYVSTVPAGASCVLNDNGRQVDRIDATPAIARVPNHDATIAIVCRRPGYYEARASTQLAADTEKISEFFGAREAHDGGTTVSIALVPLHLGAN